MAIGTTLPAAVTALTALQTAITALQADQPEVLTFELGNYRVVVNPAGLIISITTL
jgi:hypothetical protein